MSRPARIAWLLLILATLYVCYFHNLGTIGLIGPDEPRYAWIARAMVETGDWVTPRLYGKPWFEKPVLYYWGAAASFKIFGVSEAAARLPSAVSALLATLALAWLAWGLYGAATAQWLLLLLPTTVGMIGFSHAAASDMPFAAMLTIAMVFATRLVGLEGKEVNEVDEVNGIPPLRSFASLSFTSSTSFTSFFFGFFLGLAVLAKGPAAIILAGGAVLLWATFTKRWRDAFRCLHPIAIVGFCLTALPWYILCARRNPDFFRIFIIEHNFKRYLTPEFQHIQPFWFYIPILLLAVFPWTVLLIPLGKQVLEEYKTQSPELARVLFFLSWPTFALLFFTVSKSKLPGYILPAVPPLLVLVAKPAVKSARKRSEHWLTVVLGMCFLALGLGFCLASIRHRLPRYTDAYPSNEEFLISWIAVIAGLAVAGAVLIRNRDIPFLAAGISVLLLVLVADQWLHKLDPQLTAGPSLFEASRRSPGFNLSSAASWQLRRSLFYQLNFYAHADLPEWKPGGPKPAWLFVEPRFEGQARALGFSCPDYLIYPAVIACKNSTSVAHP